MSFQVWLASYTGDFPTAMVENAFAPFIAAREPGKWNLADSLAEVWIEDEDSNCGGFMVTRPPGDEAHPFWKALLEIMQQTPTVLYWISAGPKPYMVVADPAVIPTLPPDMIEALGTPGTVKEPEEFWEYIIASD